MINLKNLYKIKDELYIIDNNENKEYISEFYKFFNLDFQKRIEIFKSMKSTLMNGDQNNSDLKMINLQILCCL